jgi:hypothetical protein
MPRTATSTPSKEILEAALQGLELQKQKLDNQIEQVRGLMGKRSAGRPPKSAPVAAASSSSQEGAGRGGRKRTLSAEARKRIAAAQKKRWANFRKSQQ